MVFNFELECELVTALNGLGVPRSGGGTQAFDLSNLGARHRHGEGADVFLDVPPVLGAGNRDDVVAVGEQPRERELAGRAAFLPGERFDAPDKIEILLKVVTLKARMVLAPIALGDVLRTRDLAGEEPAAERTIRDEPDAELPYGAEELVLDVAAPQRVFRLQRSDGVDRVRPPHRLR